MNDDVFVQDDAFAEIVSDDPFQFFESWFEEATLREVNDPNAMAIATTGADGLPDVRMVLMKGVDAHGFVFYTNTQSQKAAELRDNMRAAGVLHWKSLRRQVRFRGAVEFVMDAEADEYFASRARSSRIGAWASAQSRTLSSRAELEAAVAREESRFSDLLVPRPRHWRGFRVQPIYFEFWAERPFRLHDRLVFRRSEPGKAWTTEKLYP